MEHQSRTVLVTGATGTVGSRVVAELAEQDVTARAAVRDPETASIPDGVEVVAFDFEKPETWGRAFEGVDAMFLVRPPAISRVHESITPAIDAAGRVGVDHVVFLSVLGAEKNPLLPHRRIEKHLEASDVDYTFLRASFFMQNFTEVHRQEISDGQIVVPAGDGATSFVDAADVAAVAALALTESGHRGQAYDLTGSEALTYHEVAAVFSDVLGREVVYTDPSLFEFVRHARSQGRSWGFALVMAGLYTTARLGLADRTTDDVSRLLGRSPGSLDAFVAANSAAFAPSDNAKRLNVHSTPMQLTVFGAGGRTGVPLVEQALAAGHDVTAFVRDRSTFALEHERLTVVEGDAYTGEGVAEAVTGADAVLSALGQTESGPDDLLSVAGEHVLAAMADHDVDRFVTLVGAGVTLPGESPGLLGTAVTTLLRVLNPEVLADAEAHVEAVRESDRRWTVVRAPRLSEADPRGEYRTGDVTPGRKAVARADVAAFMLETVAEDRYVHDLPKITY